MIINSECLSYLRTMSDSSVDAIVTDPPYGLSNTSPDKVSDTIQRWVSGDRQYIPSGKGFMGKEWDSFVPPVAVWDECLRVLKPGGHMAVFAGSRTQDLMGLAVRLSGFDIRDSLAWLYGCLTADADVLTDRGWVNGLGVREGDLVAQWDHDTGRITLAPVERTFRAPWDGPMRVLRSSDTDQVLTPNHRVYHQTYERKQSSGARTGSWSAWKVAEAGGLGTWQATRLPIAGTHDGPGIGGEDYAALLGWVWTEGGFDQSGSGVRIYQSSVNPEKCDEIAALLDRMGPHKRYDYARTYTRRNGQTHQYTGTTWFISGDIANRVREDLPGKRPTYDLLWRMTAAEKRAMLRAAMLGDGSGWGGSSPQFYQKHEDDLVWLQTLLALIGQSGKVTMRDDRQGGQLSLRQRGTTDLQARHLRTSTEHYTGEVWCVKVPSGAFVARRNGRVFITGNSGFPKSLDVSKAIDKAAGAEREVVGSKITGNAKQATSRTGEFADGLHGGTQLVDITAPATPDAERWDGWGTALKPGHEPIILARKPFPGTVAGNVLTHGTGALNIDATRVAGDVPQVIQGGHKINGGRYNDSESAEVRRTLSQPHDAGRWPANVALDEDQAEALDEQKANASRFFYCPKAGKKERPEVNGVRHNTVKPLELMRWLVRLITPPGGVVLDPFAGSGTTAEACILEGFDYIVVENEAQYIPLIDQRVSRAT